MKIRSTPDRACTSEPTPLPLCGPLMRRGRRQRVWHGTPATHSTERREAEPGNDIRTGLLTVGPRTIQKKLLPPPIG